MKPVLTREEMREADEKAQAKVPIEALIERAGHAVAAGATRLLGGTYGRRIEVVAGRGHNGDDGRVAAALLARRGARVAVHEPGIAALGPCELVIDAAYGTGFHGDYAAPTTDAPVLAVDIASGLDADTGHASEHAVVALATVTFEALKPGLLLGEGPEHSGEVTVAPIGLDAEGASTFLVEARDLAALSPRGREANKWQSSVYVVAGSPGMYGAAALCVSGAMRAGAGMVRIGSPGAELGTVPVLEAVARPLGRDDWSAAVLGELERCRALVVGPGLSRSDELGAEVRRLLERSKVPTVLDADGLFALSGGAEAIAALRAASAPLVLTPHEGEFARLVGGAIEKDRIEAVRSFARRSGAITLLKGPTTIVAAPSGEVRLCVAGSPALATAGTGDVLSGVIGAFLARGLPPLDAAALGALVHGLAARRGPKEGLIAGDLPRLVADELAEHVTGRRATSPFSG